LLSARVASTLSGNTLYEPDRELFGQGLASIAACAFGGMPATGAIARTAVNVKSGGTTRFASIIHGIFLLAVIYVGTHLVSQIPLAALAGVLMVTAIRMFPVTAAKEIIRSTKSDALVFVATALITVAFDLIDAVIIGVAATAFFSLRALVRTSGIHREEVPLPPQPEDRHIAIFRLDGALFFGAADSLIERLRHIDDVRVAIVRMSGLQFLDATGAHVLVEISTALERRGVHVVLKGIRAEHRVLLNQLGLPKLVDVTATLDEALAQARARVARDSTR
jgi:SulP family sulfate permease